MFPMDVATYEVCLELGVAAYFEEGVYGETTSTHNVYGDMDFRICMFLKNAMVQDMLELDNDLLVQDIDMVWLKDPISKLEHLAYKNCYDFMYMYDGHNPRFQPSYYNSGFGFIRNNEFTKRTWQVVFENYHMIWATGSQQVPLNTILNSYGDKGLRTHRLDEGEFLNGHKITPNKTYERNTRQSAYVVHSSWTENLSGKLKMLKRNGLWFLD